MFIAAAYHVSGRLCQVSFFTYYVAVLNQQNIVIYLTPFVFEKRLDEFPKRFARHYTINGNFTEIKCFISEEKYICFFNVCKDIHYLILAFSSISFVICCVNFVSKVTTNYKRSLINTYKFLFQRRMRFNYRKKAFVLNIDSFWFGKLEFVEVTFSISFKRRNLSKFG